MGIWLGDTNRLLAIAIWLFAASGFVMLRQPGHGIAYLGPRKPRLIVPSWRAAFRRRLAMAVFPLHAFWPMAEVDVLAASRPRAMRELQRAAARLERTMRAARPMLAGAALIVAVALPLRILVHGADRLCLAMLAAAYLLYLAAIAALLLAGRRRGLARPAGYWKTVTEPLLCLPYCAHLFRRLSELHALSVPLVDLLDSSAMLGRQDLETLALRIDDMAAIDDDDDTLRASHYRALKASIAARLTRWDT